MTPSDTIGLVQTIYAPSIIPTNFDRPLLFLAGSTSATDWRTTLTTSLSQTRNPTQPSQNTSLIHPISILNPHRSDWDSSWIESPSFHPFAQQVNWEFSSQERADIIAFYFEPATQAPMTLMELGLWAKCGKCIVCCPEGYWKRGYVQMVCGRYNVELVGTLEELGAALVRRVQQLGTDGWRTRDEGILGTGIYETEWIREQNTKAENLLFGREEVNG